jgi:hypothetical protein
LKDELEAADLQRKSTIRKIQGLKKYKRVLLYFQLLSPISVIDLEHRIIESNRLEIENSLSHHQKELMQVGLLIKHLGILNLNNIIIFINFIKRFSNRKTIETIKFIQKSLLPVDHDNFANFKCNKVYLI